MVALTEGEQWGWGSAPLLGLLACSVAFSVAWVAVEKRSRSPMVDIRMLTHRPVLLTNIATMISGFALFSCFVLVPSFVQSASGNGYGFGATATQAGLFLLPSSVAMLFAGPLAGTIGRRVGSKWPLAGGMLIVSVAALLFAVVHDDPGPVLVASALLGLGVGAAFAAMAALIADNVDPLEMGVASGMNTVVRMIGAVVGGQVGAVLLTAQTIGDGVDPGRVGLHDGVRAERRHRAGGGGHLALDRYPAAAAAARAGRSPPLAIRPPQEDDAVIRAADARSAQWARDFRRRADVQGILSPASIWELTPEETPMTQMLDTDHEI